MSDLYCSLFDIDKFVHKKATSTPPNKQQKKIEQTKTNKKQKNPLPFVFT